MTTQRRIVLEWAERGRIAEADLPRALALAGVLPSRDAWRRFLDRLSLWMGTVLVAAALIFFLASNWDDLGRFAKLGLAEALVVVALAVVWRLGLDRLSGKAALLAASLFLGALLALIGQTYQTGADTFELFAAWAAMILPWVLVSRFTPLWLVWLALVDTAIVLYFQALPSIFGVLLTTDRMLWALLAFNTAALAVWEAVAANGIEWLRPRWAPRLVATASGACATALVLTYIAEAADSSLWAVPMWLAWLAAAWAVYRRAVKDVFVLTGGVLSVIVVVATFLAERLSDDEAGAVLLVGLVVIGLSAVGGMWLKHVAGEDEG